MTTKTARRFLPLLATLTLLVACDEGLSDPVDASEEVVRLDDAQLIAVLDATEAHEAAGTELELDIDIDLESAMPVSLDDECNEFARAYCDGQAFLSPIHTHPASQYLGAGQCYGYYPQLLQDICIVVDETSPCLGYAAHC